MVQQSNLQKHSGQTVRWPVALVASLGPIYIVLLDQSFTLFSRNLEYLHVADFSSVILVGTLIWLGGALCLKPWAKVLRYPGTAYLLIGPLWLVYRVGDGFVTLEIVKLAIFMLALALAFGLALFLGGRRFVPLVRVGAFFAAAIVATSMVSLFASMYSTTETVKATPAAGLTREAGDLPNIYHIILDEFQSDVFEAILTPEMREKLSGFTYYPNATSSYGLTESSLASIFRSHEYQAEMPFKEYLVGSWLSDESLIQVLRSVDYMLYGYLHSEHYYRYLDRSTPTPFDKVELHREAARQAMGGSNRSLIWATWAYTSLPRPIARRVIPNRYLVQLDENALMPDDVPYLSYLAFTRMIELEEGQTHDRGRYTFAHFILPHRPHVMTRDGHYEEKVETNELEQARATMNLVAQLIEVLKRNGRFEESAIMIHSDHGSNYSIPESLASEEKKVMPIEWQRLLRRSRPLMLFKPPGRVDDGEVMADQAPAALIDVMPTLLDALGLHVDFQMQGLSLLDPSFPAMRKSHFFYYERDRESGNIVKDAIQRYALHPRLTLISDGEVVPIHQLQHDANHDRIKYVFELPNLEIESLRIDPTDAEGADILLNELYLECDGEKTIVALGSPGALQLVRMERLEETGEGVHFRGLAGNSPWFAPVAFHNLDLSKYQTVRLVLKMKVDRGEFVRVLWDTGDGYTFGQMNQRLLEISSEVASSSPRE